MPALRKYLETTMSVANCDQPVGISAPSILNTTDPSGFVITLVRPSQVMSPSGSPLALVYRRSKVRPRLFFEVPRLPAAPVCADSPWGSVWLFTRLFSLPTIVDCAMLGIL